VLLLWYGMGSQLLPKFENFDAKPVTFLWDRVVSVLLCAMLRVAPAIIVLIQLACKTATLVEPVLGQPSGSARVGAADRGEGRWRCRVGNASVMMDLVMVVQ
jgi:hypothetical protein